MTTKTAPIDLDLEQLETVTGGKGIFEAFGPGLFHITEAQGKGLDIGTQIAAAGIPFVGTAYGAAQGLVDLGTTLYGYSQGTNNLAEVGIAAAGLGAAFIPGSGLFKAAGASEEAIAGLGKLAEWSGGQLINGTTLAAQTFGNGVLGMNEEARSQAKNFNEEAKALDDAHAQHDAEAAQHEHDSNENVELEQQALDDAHAQHDAEAAQHEHDSNENFELEQQALDDAHAQHDAQQDHPNEQPQPTEQNDSFNGDQGFGGGGDFGDFGGDY